MTIPCRHRTAKLRYTAIAGALVLAAGMLTALPATATTSTAETSAAATSTAVQQAVDGSVAAAAAAGIDQSVSVVDRGTGVQVAGSGGGTQYISESIVKLFTVAYYEVQTAGQPDDSMAETLRTMIVNSDDDIESSLWNVDIVPSMAARYGLANTSNGPRTGPHDWGWELITADDETKFLYEMSNDTLVAPLLLDAMAATARSGADGSDQYFGMNTVSGDHGSKQGWTDADAGSSEPAEIHSVGWTDKYFVAILQTADSPDFEGMRSSATATAQAVLAAEDTATAAPDAGPSADPTAAGPAVQTGPETSAPTEAGGAPLATSEAPLAAGATPVSAGGFPQLIAALSREFEVLIADLHTVIEHWG